MRSVEKASATAEDVTMRNSGEVEGKPKSRSEAKASGGMCEQYLVTYNSNTFRFIGSANAHGPVDQVMAETSTAGKW